MLQEHHFFRNGVPEWLKYVAVITTLFPTIMVFSAATVGIPQSMGYYGISANDVQFGMLIFYAVVVAYTPLGSHFFSRLPPLTYLWISVILQTLALYGAYRARSLEFLLVMRFLNAIFNTGINSICLDILFGKLKTPNARKIGYGFFYGMILSAVVLCGLLGAYSFENQDISSFYRLVMFSFLPGPIMLTFILRNKPLVPFKLMRFSKMGWVDFVNLSVVMISIGYVLVYGQELGWLDHPQICWAAIIFVVFSIIELIRLLNLKNPYINLAVFKSANFRFEILLLIILYFIRGGFNLTLTYYFDILESPVLETNQLLLFNVLGIVIGSAASTYMLIKNVNIRLIWIAGFLIMLSYYGVMSFRFSINASVTDFIFLLIAQGIGQGLLMNPIIEFYISAVPARLAPSSGTFGVMMRYLFFATSLSLINFSQTYSIASHQQQLTQNFNPADNHYQDYIKQMKSRFQMEGLTAEKKDMMVNASLKKILHKELFVEYAQNYYQWICLLIIVTIVLVILMPTINKTVLNLKNKRPFGAGF